MTAIAGSDADHIGSLLNVRCHRLERRATVLEVEAPGYQEFFFVVTTRDTVTITAFDSSDKEWEQPADLPSPAPLRLAGRPCPTKSSPLPSGN